MVAPLVCKKLCKTCSREMVPEQRVVGLPQALLICQECQPPVAVTRWTFVANVKLHRGYAIPQAASCRLQFIFRPGACAALPVACTGVPATACLPSTPCTRIGVGCRPASVANCCNGSRRGQDEGADSVHKAIDVAPEPASCGRLEGSNEQIDLFAAFGKTASRKLVVRMWPGYCEMLHTRKDELSSLRSTVEAS